MFILNDKIFVNFLQYDFVDGCLHKHSGFQGTENLLSLVAVAWTIHKEERYSPSLLYRQMGRDILSFRIELECSISVEVLGQRFFFFFHF